MTGFVIQGLICILAVYSQLLYVCTCGVVRKQYMILVHFALSDCLRPRCALQFIMHIKPDYPL